MNIEFEQRTDKPRFFTVETDTSRFVTFNIGHIVRVAQTTGTSASALVVYLLDGTQEHVVKPEAREAIMSLVNLYYHN